MPSFIRQKLELGNHYASNNQWHNAADAFRDALKLLYPSVGSGKPLSRDPAGLEKAVEQALETLKSRGANQEQGHDVFDFSSTPWEPALKALKPLRDTQAATHPELGLERARFMSAFPAGGTNRWIIVYHDRKGIGVPPEEKTGTPGLEISIPSDKPVAFVLDIGDGRFHSAHLSANRAAQLSYAYSHLAWSTVSTTMQLYTVGKILIDCGRSEVLKAARDYFRALLLMPESSWVLARIGETYRNIANSWPPKVEAITTPKERVKDYVTAIRYFERAIEVARGNFWAHAHLGAAIVNVRAFTEKVHPYTGEAIDRHLLDELVKTWYRDGTLTSKALPEPPRDRAAEDALKPELRVALDKDLDQDLLDKALESLSEAQNLRGNFYPWAQLYAGNVLLIQGVALEKQDCAHAQELGIMGMVFTLSAISLQSELAGDLFEPGELHDNPFYSVGLLYLWHRNYTQAWRYVCMGLSRAFKFQFIPGLDVLLGYRLLANIADEYVVEKPLEPADVQFPEHVLGLLPPMQDLIKATPFTKREHLVAFIDRVFENECRPMVENFTAQDVEPDTNIGISLVQVCCVLEDFQKILKKSTGGSVGKKAESLREKMGEHIDEIRRKLGLRRKRPDPTVVHGDAREVKRHKVELLSTHVYTQGLSYHAASMLEFVKPTE